MLQNPNDHCLPTVLKELLVSIPSLLTAATELPIFQGAGVSDGDDCKKARTMQHPPFSETMECHFSEAYEFDSCTGDIRHLVLSPNDEYRRLIVKTAQALSESLLTPVPQPEQFDLVDLMLDVGDNLGYKVEISQGRVMVRAKAGVRHQHAQFSLSHTIFGKKDWLILTELHVKLATGNQILQGGENLSN